MNEPTPSTSKIQYEKSTRGCKRTCNKELCSDFEERVTRWLTESDDSDYEDEAEEFVIESVGDSDTEQEIEENESSSESEEEGLPQVQQQDNYFYGRNRYKWAQAEPSRTVRTALHNIIRQFPSPTLPPNSPKDEMNLWNQLFDNQMLDEIMKWTNLRILHCRSFYSNANRPELQDVEFVELKAFLGLLIYRAVFKSNHENVNNIFATDGSGREIFTSVMSRNRFLVLLNCLRFDNPNDRKDRLKDDPSAPISFLFNKFVQNSQNLYKIRDQATIDEMLMPFRGRCRFIVYMPKKTAKYGLKVMCLCDSKTNYILNGYLYCGKGSDGYGLSDADKKLMTPTHSVLRVIQPIIGSRRNITADNWFSSIELIDMLKQKCLTYVGTLKKNKREIPKEFQPNKNRETNSTLYGFTKDITLISHVPKKNKAVLLCSSMHHCKAIDNDNGKPEIISFYNSTKGGVDELDKKCSIYTCSRGTKRWPMFIFFRLLDISKVNAYVIYQAVTESTVERGQFLKKLAFQLVTPHLQRRSLNEILPRELRMTITRILGPNASPCLPPLPSVTLEKRKTCTICPPKLKRREGNACISCSRPICGQYSFHICKICSENL